MNKTGYFLLFIIVLIIDRATKYWVMAEQVAYNNGSFFGIELSYNRGISWGMFHSENSLSFALLSFVIACTLLYFLWYTYIMYRANKSIVAYIFVCAGAISNFIDRLWYGKVIDFILFYWKQVSFPVFNIADVCIFCGIMYILCFQYRDSCEVLVKK